MTNDTKSSLLARRFWSELASGFPEKTADSTLRTAYELQKKRLDDEGLELHVEAAPHGHFPEGREIAGWMDLHYKTRVVSATAIYRRIFYRKGETKPLKKDEGNYFLYTGVTDCRDYARSGEESYACPNCGSMSTIGELQSKGCSYCGTKFNVSELYPRVSGYYAVKTVGGTENEVSSEIKRSVKPFLIAFMILGLILSIAGFDQHSPVASIFSSIFSMAGAALLGGILGYLFWAAKMFGTLFIEAGKSIPKLPALGSSKKFTEKMKHYSEEFSYEYFTNRVISLLKEVIYSSNDEKLPSYTGPETTRFDHVVESSFTGVLALKDFSIDGSIITARLMAYMENFYCRKGSIHKKEEKIPLTVQKDLSGNINYHFNIKAMKCPSCGGSFDALRERICPYCGCPLDLRKQDWIITKIG